MNPPPPPPINISLVPGAPPPVTAIRATVTTNTGTRQKIIYEPMIHQTGFQNLTVAYGNDLTIVRNDAVPMPTTKPSSGKITVATVDNSGPFVRHVTAQPRDGKQFTNRSKDPLTVSKVATQCTMMVTTELQQRHLQLQQQHQHQHLLRHPTVQKDPSYPLLLPEGSGNVGNSGQESSYGVYKSHLTKIGSGITVHPIGNVNSMSYQPTKIVPQATVVAQGGGVAAVAGSATTVVLPTASAGTLGDLRRVAASGTTVVATAAPPSTSSGMKMYRTIAPKPSTITIAPTTLPPAMVVAATTTNPIATLCSTVPMPSLTSSVNPPGSIPLSRSLIVQPIVTSQQQLPSLQQPSLYGGGGSGQVQNLVLPVGTTIKVTPTTSSTLAPDQYIQHSVPLVLATQQPQQQQQQQQQIHNISIAPQPAGLVASNKMMLNTIPATTTSTTNVRSTIKDRRASVVGPQIPPLYVPPNKAGVITSAVIKSAVPVTAPATSTSTSIGIAGAAPKIAIDGTSRIVSAVTSAGDTTLRTASLARRRMSVGGGVIKPNPAAICEQQTLAMPKLAPFTAPKTAAPQYSVPLPANIPIQARQFIPMPPNLCVVQHGKVTIIPHEQQQPQPHEEDLPSDADESLVMDLGESNTQEENVERVEKVEQQGQESGVEPEAMGSPKRQSSNRVSAGTKVSPRLQKRSASEHQRPVSEAVHPTPPIARREIPMKRRFSEFPTVRPLPAGVTIPFIDENYYIPLNGTKPAAVCIGDPMERSPVTSLPQANSSNISLLCTEKLETVKEELEQQLPVNNNSRPSVVKLAKAPKPDPFMVSFTTELEKELQGLGEDETVRKKARLQAKGESVTPRSTSTSSDSNMAVGAKFGGRRSGPSPERTAQRKQTAGGNARKNVSGRSSQAGTVSLVTPSESSTSLQDDGNSLCDATTVADQLRWYDGIGYLAEGDLHFEFNKFGMVQPLTAEQYERHCVTDVYRNMQLPIAQRPTVLCSKPKSRRPKKDETGGNEDDNDDDANGHFYRCSSCFAKGTAAEFVTPQHCSIQCIKETKNGTLLKYIHNSTHALQNGASQLLGTKVPSSKSAKIGGSQMKANEPLAKEQTAKEEQEQLPLAVIATSKKRSSAKRQRKTAAPKSSTTTNTNTTTTTTTTSDDDSMSSLSLNSSTFLKRQQFLELLPSSLDADCCTVKSPAAATATPDGGRITTGEESVFSWPRYLKHQNAEPAPVDLFGRQPYPATANNPFRVGMKLEAIDPENCSLFCVCTVSEVRGYRMRLHIDGYPGEYDFWVNADSIDIFPPGWCHKTQRVLQPPASYVGKTDHRPFHWKRYLQETRAPVPESEWFAHLDAKNYAEMCKNNKFEIGMALEADDLKKSGKVCVASVADKLGDRILVHFDGWDDRYDYWVSIYSNYIHPVNWHKENNEKITAPPDWNKTFDWAKYLRSRSRDELGTIGQATKSLFRTREPLAFKPAQRLEVVDRKQKKLIRPATVVAVDGYELKLCFDGWPRSFAFWIEDDSPDLHPIQWCERTNHPLELPPNYPYEPDTYEGNCEIKFCRSRGNAKFPSKKYHDRSTDCPYRRSNWMSEDRKSLRIREDQVLKQIAVDVPELELSESKQKTPSDSVKYIAKEILMDVSLRTAAASSPAKLEKVERRASVASVGQSATESSATVKRIKREVVYDSTTATTSSSSTPTPSPAPATRDPPKERIVRLTKESETIAGTEPTPAVQESIRLALPVIEEYGPQLLHSYETWRQHSRYLDECTERSGVLRKNPLHWTTDEMARYIAQVPGCDEYANRIRHEEITGRSFLSFNQADLINYLGVKIGPAIKIYNRIIRLRQLVTSKFIQL